MHARLIAWSATDFSTQPAPGPYVLMEPTAANTLLALAGDVTYNVGVFVLQIVRKSNITLPAKYALLETDRITREEMLQIWAKSTGQAVTHLHIYACEYERIWGKAGSELAMNWQLFYIHPTPEEWGQNSLILARDLSLEKSLRNTEDTFRSLKTTLLGEAEA